MRFYLLLILLFAGCASRVSGPVPAAPQSQEREKQPAAKAKIATVDELKNAVSANFTSSERARIAFSFHNDETSRKIAGKLISLFPRSFSLELVGLENALPEEALPQLDPKTTSALVYVHYKKAGDLFVSLNAADGSFSRNLNFDYDYSDAVVSPEPSNLGEFNIRAKTAACDKDGNIFVSDGERILVTDLLSKKEELSMAFPCPDSKFFDLEDTVSVFCRVALKGISFTKKGDIWEKTEVDSFPLPARAARFIYAQKDENGSLSLFDKRDNKLASFTDLCVVSNRGTTVFAGISPEGDIWGLRGDLISMIPTVLKGPYTGIASGRQSIFALSADGKIEQISLLENFEWAVKEIKLKHKEPPLSIAFREGQLLIFYPGGSGSVLYSVDIAEDKSGGE
jgi:hypothetical protein